MHEFNLQFVDTYYHIFATHMMLYPCFILIFEDLPMIPFILVINLQDKKILFCVFLDFRKSTRGEGKNLHQVGPRNLHLSG
jgi:hypothetical protein